MSFTDVLGAISIFLIIAGAVFAGIKFLYLGNNQTPTQRQRINIALMVIGGMLIVVLIAACVSYLPTFLPTITNNFTHSSALYQVDFSQGNPGWVANPASPKWTYNETDKVLESNGRMPCCYPSSAFGSIALIAPKTITTSDYTIKARIRVSTIYGQDNSFTFRLTGSNRTA